MDVYIFDKTNDASLNLCNQETFFYIKHHAFLSVGLCFQSFTKLKVVNFFQELDVYVQFSTGKR